MKHFKILFLLLFALSYYQIEAQKKNYNFFLNENNGILYFETGYANESFSNVMNRGNGISFGLGINLAYFINKKYIFAPYAGIRTVWGEKYKSNFISELNTGIQYPDLYQELLDKQEDGTISEEESIELRSYDEAITRLGLLSEGSIDGGCLTMYYGVVLKPHLKYFPPLKLYRLQTNSSVKRPAIFEYESNYFHYPRNGWGAEIVLFRGKLLTKNDLFGNVGIGSIHLFFETADIQRTRLYKGSDDSFDMFMTGDVYLEELTNETFKNQYPREWKFGFKIALTYM